MAEPILPLEWFEMKRTGSRGSRVGPLVTNIFFPRNGPFCAKRATMAETICSGSAIRPFPSSPLAKKPLSGSIICTPCIRSLCKFSCVVGCANISRSMVGATHTGARIDRYVVTRRLSAIPCDIFASVLAVAGAITIRSAHSPNDMWLFQSPFVGL